MIGAVDVSLAEGFVWRDGTRLVRFASGAAGEAVGLLKSEKLTPCVLLTTPRAVAAVPGLAAAAVIVAHVPAGPVPEAAAATDAHLDRAAVSASRALVALGGGRVIDVAKALAAAHGLDVVAVPTTLSGAEMTPIHRPLPDGRGAGRLAPRLVVTDPELLTQRRQDLAASAMNAFGHAMEALYLPGRSPVTSLAALGAVELLLRGLEAAEGERGALALGGLLAGYAIGATGLGFHHALCQTIVRESGAPHAGVYAVMAPHSLRFMLPRAPLELAPLMALLAGRGGSAHLGERDGGTAVRRLAAVAAQSGLTTLSELGVGAAQLPAIAAAAVKRSEVRNARGGRPSPDEVLALLTVAY